MKKLLISVAIGLGALTLGACSAIPGSSNVQVNVQEMQTKYVQACIGYGAALNAATQLRAEGKLNAAEINQVSMISHQISPICGQTTIPADPTTAISEITAAVASLGIMEAAHAIQHPVSPVSAPSSTVSK